MVEGRLLGIDHGLKRIGLAVCDSSRLVARELTILHRKSKAEDFDTINRIAAEHDVSGIVVGLPSDIDAPVGTHTQAHTVRLWVERLQNTTDLPVIFWDEQLSSEDARALAHRQRRRPADLIDDLAARLILQSYLDACRDGLASPL
jgi:putative holliday junction resolvase